jgi:carbon monoxide dehydrogenase subunit G
MNLSGEIKIHAPREEVFKALRNARLFASCIEGVRDLEEIDEAHYTAVVETKIAYMRFKFKVNVAVDRIEFPDFIEASVEGTPLGIVGRLTATSRTTLFEEAGGTRVAYSMDVVLAGKLGAMGQPVLRAKAKEIERQFAKNLCAVFETGAVKEAVP